MKHDDEFIEYTEMDTHIIIKAFCTLAGILFFVAVFAYGLYEFVAGIEKTVSF